MRLTENKIPVRRHELELLSSKTDEISFAFTDEVSVRQLLRYFPAEMRSGRMHGFENWRGEIFRKTNGAGRDRRRGTLPTRAKPAMLVTDYRGPRKRETQREL